MILRDRGLGKTYIVFNKNQIKSATNNNGDFDINKNSIFEISKMKDAISASIKTNRCTRMFLSVRSAWRMPLDAQTTLARNFFMRALFANTKQILPPAAAAIGQGYIAFKQGWLNTA